VGNVNLKPLSKIDAAGMLDTFNINVVGAALAVKHAKTALTDSAETGSVVLFSSVAASQGFPMHVEIGSSKAAVQGLTISLAAELAGKVRVNCIAPSLTATPLASRLLSNEAMLKAIKAAHPIPRVGNPDEMAELAEFLMSSRPGDDRPGDWSGWGQVDTPPQEPVT
jgi:NAD(P)-dependent dehydrogenase (short-subunit alcohol dehydrogenase family)